MDNRNNLIADKVEVQPGQSWYSQQLSLDYPNSGVSFEIRLECSGTVEGAFYARAGNTKRAGHPGAAYVGTTETQNLDGKHLPLMRFDGAPCASDSLMDVSAEAPCETLLNIGNVNARYVELEFRAVTGSFILSVRPSQKRG